MCETVICKKSIDFRIISDIMNSDLVFQLESVFHKMVAEQIINHVLLGYVKDTADIKMLDVILFHQFSRRAIRDTSEHDAELIERYHVGERSELLFVIASCHNILQIRYCVDGR